LNSSRILYLPYDSRPDFSFAGVCTRGNTLVLGAQTGRVMIIMFDLDSILETIQVYIFNGF
jgi:hypothetical protein